MFQSRPACVGDVRSTSPLGDVAARKPSGCSSASGDDVNPASASRAEMTPACAARPAWKGFVMVPKLATNPALWEAPSAIACVAFSALSPRSEAQAAAAAMAPKMPVGCQPFSWCWSGSRRCRSAHAS